MAERNIQESISGIYDLYEKFIEKWIEHEQKRGTTKKDSAYIVSTLERIAIEIYKDSMYKLNTEEIECTAIFNLLTIIKKDMGESFAIEFYHRSIASFLLAYDVIKSIENCNKNELSHLFSCKLKDDVTNFIGNKFEHMSTDEKESFKDNIIFLYREFDKENAVTSIMEQLIYYITRLGIDVSGFLLDIIEKNNSNLKMRLTLAYGCVLQDNIKVRDYALSYAKSIAAEGEDARTNRGWTVVYFGDVNDRDPYTYRDDEKRSWAKARKARIKRFTKTNPRLKDVRFWLFDIPLFYSFLKAHDWNDISEEELIILETLDISENYFYKNEVDFLNKTREKLIRDYRKKLLER